MKIEIRKLVIGFAGCLVFLLAAFISNEEAVGANPPLKTATSTVKTPQYGGVLRLGFPTDAVVIGWPAMMQSSTELPLSKISVESLGTYDKNGQPTPYLAEKWTLNAIAKTVTISLKKGIKFHDGTDFNAKACKWNLDQFRTSGRPELKSVSSVDVVNDYTIRLNLNVWDNTIPDRLSLGATGMMISPTAFEKNGKDWCLKHPVGTGPFKLVQWEKDVKQTYEKFDGYWQKGKPYLDKIEVIIIADPTTALAAFHRKEFDFFMVTDPIDVKNLETQGKYNIVNLKTGLGNGLVMMAGDSVHPDSPLSNVKVRQAVEYAIDKKAINDALYKGMGIITNQWSAPNTLTYNTKMTNFNYNPKKAKTLLAEAGYSPNTKLTLYCQNVRSWIDICTAIQGFLTDVGMNVDVEPMERGSFTRLQKTGWKNGWIVGRVRIASDIASQMSETVHTKGFMYAIGMAKFKDVDRLVEDALTTPNLTTKRKITLQLQQLVFDKYSMFTPILIQPTIVTKYKGYNGDGINEIEQTMWSPANAWIEK